MLGAFGLIYGFAVAFILSSLRHNKREERPNAPALIFAGRGLMAASVTGGALMLSAAAWASLAH